MVPGTVEDSPVIRPTHYSTVFYKNQVLFFNFFGYKQASGLDRSSIFHYNGMAIGVWRSLVSRLVRVQEASGSNPDTPTKKEDCPLGRSSFFFCCNICGKDVDYSQSYIFFNFLLCKFFCKFFRNTLDTMKKLLYNEENFKRRIYLWLTQILTKIPEPMST